MPSLLKSCLVCADRNLSTIVIRRSIHHRGVILRKGSHIKLLKDVAVAALLQGEGMAIRCVESAGEAGDAAVLFVIADDGLVASLRLVGRGVGRDQVGEGEGDVVDGDMIIEERLGVHLNIHAGENVGVVTTRFKTPFVAVVVHGRPDREQLPGCKLQCTDGRGTWRAWERAMDG